MYWFTALLGVVFITAPFLFQYSSDTIALWISLVVGAVLVVMSLLEAVFEDRDTWEYWVAGGAGIVAILAPFILGFSAAAVWTMAIAGVATVLATGLKLSSGRTQLR